MKITALLETDLYRYASSWEHNNEPVIHLKGRESRVAKGDGSARALILHYGLQLNNIDAPRRWASTFCTTDTERSMFIQQAVDDEDQNSGIRMIEVEPTRKCAWITDDFNGAASLRFRTLRMLEEDYLSKVDAMTRSGATEDNGIPYKQYREAADELTYFLGIKFENSEISDKEYNRFVAMCKMIDEIGHPISEDFRIAVRELIQNRTLGVGMVSDVPARNLEVWFEGDYKAIKI